MAYSELIKDVSRIRDYMREFFVYGFKSRDEVGTKSPRSYDNEKRRIESWLADYMSFRQDASGKVVFLSVDSRHIPHNPLYKAWKAASFTKNDVSLHFILLDILADGKPRSLTELLKTIDEEYLSSLDYPEPIDESTLRKKLKEYTENGLLTISKHGKQHLYALSGNDIDLESWHDAVNFFSETNPLGVTGSFILDKYEEQTSDFFSFKHRYLLFALDNGILMDLLNAIHAHQKVELELAADRRGGRKQAIVVPLKIYISTQGGRQYLAAYSVWRKKIAFFRLDAVVKVKPMETEPEYDSLLALFNAEQPHIWGVSYGQYRIEHIELTLTVDPKDAHIIQRLEREKRCGNAAKISENEWRFSANVYDAWELMPWLRTFIGRISSLTCSNKKVEQQFWSDYAALAGMYGDDNSKDVDRTAGDRRPVEVYTDGSDARDVNRTAGGRSPSEMYTDDGNEKDVDLTVGDLCPGEVYTDDSNAMYVSRTVGGGRAAGVYKDGSDARDVGQTVGGGRATETYGGGGDDSAV